MKRIYTFISLCIVCCVVACSDILIPDISDEEIFLITPLENAVLPQGDVTFQWQGIADVDEYELQIARPSFSALEVLLIDTFINNDRLTIAMPVGEYEWSVKGVNAEFSTSCCEIGRFSIIDPTVSDTISSVALISPENGTFTNQLPVELRWGLADMFQTYNLQIATVADFSTIQVNINTPLSFFEISLLNETTYFWRVIASNGNMIVESEVASFRLDYTSPFPAIPISPSNNDAVSLTTSDPDFSWQQPIDAALARLDLFSDSLATDLAYSYTTYQSAINLDTTTAIPEIGLYYWRVSVQDQAGNFSSPSPTQRVIID